MNIVSVITLVTGVALSFAGAFMAFMGAQQKAGVDRIRDATADHAKRIAYLEQRDAVQDEKIETILSRVEEIYQLLREHIREDGRAS